MLADTFIDERKLVRIIGIERPEEAVARVVNT